MNEEVLKKLKDFLNYLSYETERVERPCPGSHSYWSSMHPGADVTCPHCGNSEDGLGRDLVSYEPTRTAKTAKELLKEIKWT